MANPKSNPSSEPEENDSPAPKVGQAIRAGSGVRQGPVWQFRKNGTNRVYDIDAEHLDIMRNRADLSYIGTEPLPPPRKTGALIQR